MQNKLALLIIICLVLMGFIAGREYFPRIIPKSSSFSKNLEKVNIDSVSSINISKGKDSITIKKENQTWKVNNKIADTSKIDSLLQAIYRSDNPDIVSQSTQSINEYGLAGDETYNLVINDILTIKIGKSGIFGTYILFDGSSTVYVINGLSTSDITPNTDTWADRKIISIDKSKISKLSLTKNGKISTFNKKENKWFIDETNTEVKTELMDNALLTLGSYIASSIGYQDEISEYPQLPELSMSCEEDGQASKLEYYKGENDYLVRRISDGELYHVSASSVSIFTDLLN